MTSLGVWACQWRELKPIKFGGTGKQQNSSSTETDGIGMSRGRGAGRGHDGAGEYEMVNMSENSNNV